jgi:hypothetical protein
MSKLSVLTTVSLGLNSSVLLNLGFKIRGTQGVLLASQLLGAGEFSTLSILTKRTVNLATMSHSFASFGLILSMSRVWKRDRGLSLAGLGMVSGLVLGGATQPVRAQVVMTQTVISPTVRPSYSPWACWACAPVPSLPSITQSPISPPASPRTSTGFEPIRAGQPVIAGPAVGSPTPSVSQTYPTVINRSVLINPTLVNTPIYNSTIVNPTLINTPIVHSTVYSTGNGTVIQSTVTRYPYTSNGYFTYSNDGGRTIIISPYPR